MNGFLTLKDTCTLSILLTYQGLRTSVKKKTLLNDVKFVTNLYIKY